MSNFLSIEEAIELSEIEADDFRENYIEAGKISVQVNNGLKQIELSEFYRVFPQRQHIQRKYNQNFELELELKELKIENLNLELKINCSMVQISQVILNLLNNSYDAVKYLEKNGLKLIFKRTQKT